MSRHRSLVATSLNAFPGFNWSLLMSRRQYLVATSAQVFCSLQLMFMMSRPQSLVTTSAYVLGGFTGCFRCRDFSLLSRQLPQLNHLHPSKPVIASGGSHVATSIPSHDINPCRDITMLSRHHSLSFWLLLSCLSGTSCRDLHQTHSMILMSRPHNLDCASQKLHLKISQLLSFLLCHSIALLLHLLLHFFLLSFSLPANNKFVSFFIFLHINYSFLDENQSEKWTKNR